MHLLRLLFILLFLTNFLHACPTTSIPPQKNQVIFSIKDLKKYELFLIDLHGVIHNGISLIDSKIPDLLRQLQAKGKKIAFVSNATRKSADTKKRLQKMISWPDIPTIFTSGEVVRQSLENPKREPFKSLPQTYYLIGYKNRLPFDRNIISRFNKTNNIEEAGFIVLTRSLQKDESIETILSIFRKALKRNLPLLCVNPDKSVIINGKPKQTSGYLAHLYEKMGGTVYYAGKPYPTIFEMALSHFDISRHRAVMIGDNLETDIQGANNLGMDSVLVLTGNYGHHNSKNPEKAAKLLKKEKHQPTYIMGRLQ